MAWLCSDCCCAVETMLAAAPTLIEQLDIAASKQVKIGSGASRMRTADSEDDGNDAGLAHTRSPVNWGAVAVRDALLVELALWGDDINEIRRHQKAAEIASGIGKAVKNAYSVIDRMQERKYLGKCMNQVGGLKCHEELWVRPNAKEIRCKSCSYEHNVANRRFDMIEMARDMIVTVKDASACLGELAGIRVTEDRIRGYLKRGRIAYRPLGEKQGILLGDLWDVVIDDSERKSA
jgi:hypothetical protein